MQTKTYKYDHVPGLCVYLWYPSFGKRTTSFRSFLDLIYKRVEQTSVYILMSVISLHFLLLPICLFQFFTSKALISSSSCIHFLIGLALLRFFHPRPQSDTILRSDVGSLYHKCPSQFVLCAFILFAINSSPIFSSIS